MYWVGVHPAFERNNFMKFDKEVKPLAKQTSVTDSVPVRNSFLA